MESIPIHTLASDKLYLLASIKRAGGKLLRRDLLDDILSEGRMNYFFLCQYIMELQGAGFLLEENDTLHLTREGDEALVMFSNEIKAEDAKVLSKENVLDYRIVKEENLTIYEKRVGDKLVFSLSVDDSFPVDDSFQDKKRIIEELITRIKKADS